MAPGGFRFDRFRLDPADRLLTRDGAPVELSARYLDALMLLVREQGRLVTKERFHDEVWRGVPVTDEALTQCIRALRRQLGDDAARPRFIETVPKHGYRFIAPVEVTPADQPAPPATPPPAQGWPAFATLGIAGSLGGAVASLAGGLVYGFAAAAQPPEAGVGAASVLIVLLLVTAGTALVGGAGVSFGIAATFFVRDGSPAWRIVGGALGGLVVGAFVKLLGTDALTLLFGRSPGDITGAVEGAALGASVGCGAWLAERFALSPRRSIAVAAILGAAGGLLITLLGGRLMAGSLDLLAQAFPGSRLRLDEIGRLFGESGLGPVSQVVTGGMEGLLFGACIVGAMALVRR